jgi:hypothetical protein
VPSRTMESKSETPPTLYCSLSLEVPTSFIQLLPVLLSQHHSDVTSSGVLLDPDLPDGSVPLPIHLALCSSHP